MLSLLVKSTFKNFVVENNIIKIFTDGSCHTQIKTGAWAAIILRENKKEVLKGCYKNTTHNQMELLSVIKALEYVENKKIKYDKIEVFSDSQYVVDIIRRKDKLESSSFLTKAGKQIQNVELLKALINYINQLNIEFYKVIAHQKANENINYNREVDILVRKTLREEIRNIENK